MRKDTTVKTVIDQFMWSFQQHFRHSVEYGTKIALASIGLPEEARAVLVGFATSDDARHGVCIEPEDGPLNTGHLSAVSERTLELFRTDPDSRIHYSHAELGAQRRLDLYRRRRADAVVEAIDVSGVFDGLRFFASESAPIGDYEVHSCVGVPAGEFDLLPALDGPVVDRIYVGRSLQHEVIAECLRRADRALYTPDTRRGLTRLGPTENIVRAAAVRLTDGMVCRAGGIPTDLFHAVNEFTSLSYERAAAGGQLTIVHHQEVDDRAKVRFLRPVSVHDSRIMRKLLELSNESTPVITDGRYVYGLGTPEPAHDAAEIRVRDRAEWELSVDSETLMRVSYGQAKLPRPPLTRRKFDDIAQRTLGSVDSDRIWPIVEAARSSGHGTILVVSNNPEQEATRLGGQAVPVRPEWLAAEDIARFGLVDGAILLGPDGRCHAFGVILDGKATGHGDPARGSRLNSAVRYQKTYPDTLLVVISDDGPVDLVPDLKPKVHRDQIEASVQAFCNACEADPHDGEQFTRTHDKVEKLAFYLNDNQCQRVNQAHEQEMRRRLEAGGIAAYRSPLRPNPEMDESYFH